MEPLEIFRLSQLGRTDLRIVKINMEKEFSPLNTDFYEFAARNGCCPCPTIVPCFSIAVGPTGLCVAVETQLYSFWEFKDGICQKLPDNIDEVFYKYCKEKGFSDNVFDISSPDMALRFINSWRFDIKKIVDSSLTFYNKMKQNPNGRYRSWEHCFSMFAKARNRHNSEADIDLLCLHLAFYLASWGMYRGSSFLLQRDYRIHKPAVEEILRTNWDKLLNPEMQLILEDPEIAKAIIELGDKLKGIYDGVRSGVYDEDVEDNIDENHEPKMDISSILITKILMGTLGCSPAYDRYFKSGIKSYKIASTQFNEKSIRQLAQHYQDNVGQYETVRTKMIIDELNIPYPQMKVLDMAFWQIGADIDFETQKNTQINKDNHVQRKN